MLLPSRMFGARSSLCAAVLGFTAIMPCHWGKKPVSMHFRTANPAWSGRDTCPAGVSQGAGTDLLHHRKWVGTASVSIFGASQRQHETSVNDRPPHRIMRSMNSISRGTVSVQGNCVHVETV